MKKFWERWSKDLILCQAKKVFLPHSRNKSIEIKLMRKCLKAHYQGVSLNKNSKMVYFYGDASSGTNSRIKGHLRRGHTKLLKEIGQGSYVAITPKFRTSKLCCFCHEPLIHPKKFKKDRK
ncbi:uncharacterized protein BX664DRAFT_349583 [Halteromyces radiatus]|uniref:uncharacterized protein n=1 Tax=Halteromyces radiatus TaxID=101107 RepID=UPI0022204AF4|nr:uncharacterized protein BX664DRAFT_349583 [Halteromyces radiatus]KAI8089181.1 hypothetical protein BX664DRAFT_349583 [Halteromyces radiatus]